MLSQFFSILTLAVLVSSTAISPKTYPIEEPKTNQTIERMSFAVAAPDLSKKARVWPNGLSFDIIDIIDQYLTVPSAVGSNTGSDLCDTGKCAANSAGNTLFTSLVTYSDGSSVTFCVCPTPVMTFQYSVFRFARVPFQVRKTVKSITIATNGAGFGGAGQGAYTYTQSGQSTYLGTNMPTQVFIHESAHAWDAAIGSISSTPAWFSALNTDTCIPDYYAATAPIEDFAQMVVSYVYIRGSKTLANTQYNCMRQQINILRNYLPLKNLVFSK